MASFSTSERWKLDLADGKKIARLVIVAGLGAALNELVTQVANIDFAEYQQVADAIGIVAGASVVEFLRRLLSDFSHG